MIPLATPNLGPKEQEYAAQAIADNYIGPDGPFVRRFEEMVAKAAGRKWAVATITGSAAMEAVMAVLPFGEHSCPSIPCDSYPAMVNIAARRSMEWNYVDGGKNHDFQQYWADRYSTIGFADCAPSIGEKHPDILVETYSFAANKIITCGHGGAIVGDDDNIERQCRAIVNQGYGRTGLFNFRMANINAAIGCAQMERLDELKSAKKRIWNEYANYFPMIDRGPSRWMSTMQCDDPQALHDFLKKHHVETRVEPSGGISLPCSTNLLDQDQQIVINLIGEFLSLQADGQTQAR